MSPWRVVPHLQFLKSQDMPLFSFQDLDQHDGDDDDDDDDDDDH